MINIEIFDNLSLNVYDELLKKKELKKVLGTIIKAISDINPNYKTRKLPKPEDYNNTNGIVEVNIGEYNSSGMHIYGANVTLMRAVPDIVDGFKPLERRILYATAYISNAIKKKKKVLAIVGSVAFIHPHGDASIGDAFISMSKPWENAYPLIEIKGNNGQPTGTRAAAPRYLEGRISDYCYDCYFSEWDDNLIEMVQSYNPEYMEPEFMISKYPNILLRPVTGFTFSVSTDFPSFNMEESFNAVIKLIEDKNYEPILYPDFPCGCTIIDENQFPDICKKGIGTFKMKATGYIDYDKYQITITSLPYKVSMESVINKLIELNKNNLIPKLSNFHDYSDIYGIRLVLIFKPEADLDKELLFLYNKTPLMSTYSTHMVFVDNYELKNVNLKYIMQKWIDNRRIIKRKSHIFRRNKLLGRNHILSVLIDITSDEKKSIDMIKTIRISTTKEIVNKLMSRYENISSLQAKEIADLKVKEFSIDSNKKFVDEYNNNIKELKNINKIIDSQEMIDEIIINELKNAIGKYSIARKSKIEKSNFDKYNKDKFDTKYLIIITNKGRIKKLSVVDKGVGELNSGDDPILSVQLYNKDKLLVFDTSGLVHNLKISGVDEVSLKSKGISIGKYINLDENPVGVFLNDESNWYLLLTEKGFLKKLPCNTFKFKTSTTSSTKLKPDDKVIAVKKIDSNCKYIIIYTKDGIGRLLDIDEIHESNKNTYGMNIFDGKLSGFSVISSNDEYLTLLTSYGNGKTISLSKIDKDKLYQLIKLNKNETIVDIQPGRLYSKYIITTSKQYISFSIDAFPLLNLSQPGKKVIQLDNAESIEKLTLV